MEILKIKEWVKAKDKQFIAGRIIDRQIVDCTRIKDGVNFIVDLPLAQSIMTMGNNEYNVKVYIGHMSNDLIHVFISGAIEDLFEETHTFNLVPINDIESWIGTIMGQVKWNALKTTIYQGS